MVCRYEAARECVWEADIGASRMEDGGKLACHVINKSRVIYVTLSSFFVFILIKAERSSKMNEKK